MRRTWVVSGAGLVSAGGDTLEALHGFLLAGASAPRLDPETGLVVAPLTSFDPKRYLDRKGLKDLSRTSQLACAAAPANARGLSGVEVGEIGVVLGSAWGSLTTIVDFERQAHVQGPRFVDPLLFTETVANVAAGQVAIYFGWSAFNATLSAGAASGLASIRRALLFLEEERGAIAVAGGGDELNPLLLRVFRAKGALAASADSLPLAQGRSGFAGGEGACLLTIESEEHARARGAASLATIRATAARFVPHPERQQARASLAALVRDALARAELDPARIELVVLPANGSASDVDEAGVILDVFGSGRDAPSLLLPKAFLGETWGAAGPLALACATQVMRTGTIPGMPAGFEILDGFEGLNVPRVATERRVSHALVLDRSESGHQIGVVLSAPGASS